LSLSCPGMLSADTGRSAPLRSKIRLVAVPIAAGLIYAVGGSPLARVDGDTREALFSAIGTTAGSLLGFAIAGVTILLSVGQGPRMKWLKSKKSFRREVRFLFFSAIAGLALSSVVFFTLIAVGTGPRFQTGLGVVAAAAAALALDRLWRLTRFLNGLMRVALKDADNATLPNPPFTGPTDD